MEQPPVIVEHPSSSGGRRVLIRDRCVGTAYSDHDLVVFMGQAGLTQPDDLLDRPDWVDWRGAPAHDWSRSR
jgi:hypothetical protein